MKLLWYDDVCVSLLSTINLPTAIRLQSCTNSQDMILIKAIYEMNMIYNVWNNMTSYETVSYLTTNKI